MKFSHRKVLVKVPATTANLGPGYDVLGLALKFHNEVELLVEPHDTKLSYHLTIEIEGEGKESLPKDTRNIVWQSVIKVFNHPAVIDKMVESPMASANFRLRLKNRIPLARGMGSSAAARLGGILAANALCGSVLSQTQILNLATELEGHPDNVTPALFGGLCISAIQDGEVQFIKLKPPKRLSGVVCVPEFELSTKKARSVLPKKISHADAVHNVSRVSLLLGALTNRSYPLLKMAMEDRLHQNFRKPLIPGFDQVVKNGYEAGAYGIALSGAGPSIFAFVSDSKAAEVGQAMEKGFLKFNHPAKSLALKFSAAGAQIFC